MPASMTDRLAVCSWSLQPKSTDQLVERVRATGLSKIQLALSPLTTGGDAWTDAGEKLQAAGIGIVSGMFGFVGEDYSTLDTIRRTGGVVPDQHWSANQKIVENATAKAEALGLGCISTHVGFIPEKAGPHRDQLVDRVRWIADHLGSAGMTLLLETGQETAADLNSFLDVLDRPNVRVNFDPANMLLYGKGDPVAALEALMPRVGQVHIKDALPSTTPGQWGQEVAVGEGQVDWPAFAEVLNRGGYAGPLVIEREQGDQRVADVRQAAERLPEWFAR